MARTTPDPTTDATEVAGSLRSSDEDCADLRRVLENAIRSAKELRQNAVRARAENDHELAEFFDRCALSDKATMAGSVRLVETGITETSRTGELPPTRALASRTALSFRSQR